MTSGKNATTYGNLLGERWSMGGRGEHGWLSALVTALLLVPLGPQAGRHEASMGTWTPTGAMTEARAYHRATLLPNGQVLVTGGVSSSGLATTELYNPDMGTWAATGRMSNFHYWHTATLLPNGQVLVAGGCTSNACPDNTAELYNPITGTWTPTGTMISAHRQHTATLLNSGKVLVAGGDSSNGYPQTTAELYDPTTGTWTATGSLNTARTIHTATLLPDGQVLVAGGCGPVDCTMPVPAVDSAELYNPSTGTWMVTGGMSTGRYGHTATLLQSGKVLVTGGVPCQGCPITDTAELYDPGSGTWSATGHMIAARYEHTATLLPTTGQVLVAGSYNGCCLVSAELYDPTTGIFTATGSMNTGRATHTATLLPNGQVLVAGGYDNSDKIVASAELYQAVGPAAIDINPTSGVWNQTVTVTGTNFGSAEPVKVYWDSTSPTPLTTTNTTVSGDFMARFHVPEAVSGAHVVIAVGQTSGLTATAPFTVGPTTSVRPASAVQSAHSVISGYGFVADEQVTTYWNSQSQGGLVLGITTTNTLGSFTGASAITFTVPMSPTGRYPIISVGQTNGVVVTSTFTLKPYLRITPASGAHGSSATVVGTGYGAHERVTVKWNCGSPTCSSATVLGSKVTNASGNFRNLKVTIPATATVGTYPVGGIGKASHAFAETFYTVTS